MYGREVRNMGKIGNNNKTGFHPFLRRSRDCDAADDEDLGMYLKKVDGPRAVRLPDGSIMTRADLPPATTRRWVASRKASVVKGVNHGLIPLAEALKIYALSEEEFLEWKQAVEKHGEVALKATALQKYRQP